MHKGLHKLCVIWTIIFLAAFSQATFLPLNSADETPNTVSESPISEESGPRISEIHRGSFALEADDDKVVQQNCTDRSINDFPDDVFTKRQRQQGWIVLHTFFGFYLFILTALVCNDYLLPAMDLICADLKLSADVAGATFLATASAFPEFFVNVVGTFLTQSDLGVGTVVGAAVFNTFVVAACGAIASPKGIPLEWWPLSRDCLIYLTSIGVLGVIMWDSVITWEEAVILAILFFGYFTLLFFNEVIFNFLKTCCGRCYKTPEERKEIQPKFRKNSLPFGTYRPFVHGELVVEYRNSVTKMESNGEQLTALEEYVEPDTPFVWPKDEGIMGIMWFLFIWPLKCPLFITIPDCRYKRLRNWYPLTFIMCISWIAVTSYTVSWMMTVLGDTLEIPDSVMGISILSIGGNLPELVSIVILSRTGQGDMAMSNTLGANTLDILMCLGLPWALKTLMSGSSINIDSGALSYSVIALLTCVLAFYGVTVLNKFYIDRKVGAACLLMYGIYLAIAILTELNFFFFVNLPMCDE